MQAIFGKLAKISIEKCKFMLCAAKIVCLLQGQQFKNL
jgi:hypothetical protein